MDEIEERIRNLNIFQLGILKLLAESKHGILDSQEIIQTTHTATAQFGAFIASLKKFKSENGQPIVIPAGRTTEGMRWQLNEKVIDRLRLQEILAEMKI